MAGEPMGDAGRAAIIGRGGKTEIAEALREFGQKLCGFGDRRFGIERIGEPAIGGGSGHELRDALRAGWTDRVGSKAAFLPDQPCQERDRQTLSSGRRFDKTADGCFDGFNLAGSAMSLRANEGLLIERA